MGYVHCEGRAGPRQILYTQFSHWGGNDSCVKVDRRFLHQDPGAMGQPSIPTVCAPPKRAVGCDYGPLGNMMFVIPVVVTIHLVVVLVLV